MLGYLHVFRTRQSAILRVADRMVATVGRLSLIRFSPPQDQDEYYFNQKATVAHKAK